MHCRVSILFLSLILFFNSCYSQTGDSKNEKQDASFAYTNNLIHESSPYLLAHAHNPVNWYAWGEEAFKKARDENKMIIISIGYAACHWCHVMERESYEDTAVAAVMNKYFVSIKVDREERPDIDQVYMTAAQLINGNGGWPLNALALPDGKPFYAGTYFPKNEWLKMLNRFIDLKKQNPAALVKQADDITKGVKDAESMPLKKAAESFTARDLDKQFGGMKNNIDFKKGGVNQPPKFPMPSYWEYLLHYYYLSNNESALQAVKATLDNMANGGIYDQLGGGFARYATDADWHVPHFEKMLYDNAQLVSLYSHAFQVTGNHLYKKVVYQTLEFVSRELTSPEGGFYSSLDADSEGEEGKYYVWTKEEIEKTLGADAPLFMDFYGITKKGNWQNGRNILYRSQPAETIAKKYGLPVADFQSKIDSAGEVLMKERSKRIRPKLDDKILTSWNALMLKGYIQAYYAFGDSSLLETAEKNAAYLMKNAIGDNCEMTRNYKNGKSSVNGLLDDYAFTASAFIALYQATFDEKWLNEANKIALYTMQHFFDATSGMFYYSSAEHSNLISRKMEIDDNEIPSSNSEMAENLFFLGHYFDNENEIDKAKQMLTNVGHDLQADVYFYSNWAILEALFVSPVYEVAITGNEFKSRQQELSRHYLPNIILLGGKEESGLELLENKFVKGQTIIYVCQDKVCKLPVTETEKALKQIAK